MELTLEDSGVLTWLDLSADEVYHVAHLENEARDAAAEVFGRISVLNNVEVNVQNVKLTDVIIRNNEERSQSWFEDQASIRGLVTKRKQEDVDNPQVFKDWLEQQLVQLPGITLTEIAKKSGVSKGYLSELKNGHQSNPSKDIRQRLEMAFSEMRPL